MKTLNSRGFTLIELLVVISIIGLLSSVVLASLNTARGKATIAAGQTFDSHTYSAFGAEAKGIWNFDEPVGSTVANDSSGNNKNVTLVGGPTIVAGGIKNNAIHFNGAGSADAGIIDIDTSITVTAWVKSPNFGVNGGLVSKNYYNDNWVLLIENSRIYWRGKTSFNQISCPAPTSNTWHHIAATQSVQKATLYIDGKICGTPGNNLNQIGNETGSYSIYPTGGNVRIGHLENFGYFFRGDMDEVRIYSQSLLTSDIQQLYAEGLPTHTLAEK